MVLLLVSTGLILVVLVSQWPYSMSGSWLKVSKGKGGSAPWVSSSSRLLGDHSNDVACRCPRAVRGIVTENMVTSAPLVKATIQPSPNSKGREIDSTSEWEDSKVTLDSGIHTGIKEFLVIFLIHLKSEYFFHGCLYSRIQSFSQKVNLCVQKKVFHTFPRVPSNQCQNGAMISSLEACWAGNGDKRTNA